MQPVKAIDVVDLLPPLYDELYDLLEGLGADDWSRQTVAPQWTVKDVAAHLLDVDVRRLSFQRDGLSMPDPQRPIDGYSDLVSFLDALNATWVEASRRLSPRLLIEFLRVTGPEVCELFASLDPHEEALFAVAWAGEEVSENWFDVAREYTERWHHQQQIREAVGAHLLSDRRWLFPILDTFMRGLPRVYRGAEVEESTNVTVEIIGEGGGAWTLQREKDMWRLYQGKAPNPHALVTLHDHVAWRLFTKGLSPEEARSRVEIAGDKSLGQRVLGFVAIMG